MTIDKLRSVTADYHPGDATGANWHPEIMGFASPDSTGMLWAPGVGGGRLSAAAPGPPPPPPAAPPAVPPPVVPLPPPPLVITSATTFAAPNGAANTRTTVGVGEVVTFTGSVAGNWTATAGTLVGALGLQFAWTAPGVAGAATITLTVALQTQTIVMTTIAPNAIAMVSASEDIYPAGTAGAGMFLNTTIGPDTVSFGNVEWLEQPGPASLVAGYFLDARFPANTFYHHPNPNFARLNADNTGPQDHAWAGLPPPYSVGGYTWAIPNLYRVFTDALGGGTLFTTTYQVFTIALDGTITITKAGAMVTRTP